MNSKIKILVGILVVGIVLLSGCVEKPPVTTTTTIQATTITSPVTTTTTIPEKEISKQEALEIANQFLQSECDTTFDEIETYRGRFVDFYIDHIFGGGGPRHIIIPILERIYNQCPELEKYSNFWVAEKNVSGENIIVVVGKNGEFICGFGAWGTNLREICRKGRVTITTDKTEYEQGEMVKITVRNDLVESIWYREWDTKCSGTSFSIGKKRDNGYSFYPLGLAECAMDEVELKPKATRIYALNLNEWKKTKFPHTDIDTGVYKWRFIYILKNGDKESKTIYSNEFTIKEKHFDTIPPQPSIPCNNKTVDEYLMRGEYVTALGCLRKAREHYLEIGDVVGVSRCDELISKINEKL